MKTARKLVDSTTINTYTRGDVNSEVVYILVELEPVPSNDSIRWSYDGHTIRYNGHTIRLGHTIRSYDDDDDDDDNDSADFCRIAYTRRGVWGQGRIPVAVVVLGFSFWGATGVATLSSGGYTTNTFVLNYRVCNRLYQIINT